GSMARLGQQLVHDRRALLGCLARRVDGLGQPLAQLAVVIDARKAEVGERQPAQPGDGVVGAQRAGADVVEEVAQGVLVHGFTILPPMATASPPRVTYLGPAGTFTEEALLTQPDLADAELVPTATIAEAL